MASRRRKGGRPSNRAASDAAEAPASSVPGLQLATSQPESEKPSSDAPAQLWGNPPKPDAWALVDNPGPEWVEVDLGNGLRTMKVGRPVSISPEAFGRAKSAGLRFVRWAR